MKFLSKKVQGEIFVKLCLLNEILDELNDKAHGVSADWAKYMKAYIECLCDVAYKTGGIAMVCALRTAHELGFFEDKDERC